MAKTVEKSIVSWEVAKILKELGFNEKCDAHFFRKSLRERRFCKEGAGGNPQNLNKLFKMESLYSAPTVEQVKIWLSKLEERILTTFKEKIKKEEIAIFFPD